MPSFRSPDKQAQKIIRQHLALGQPRHHCQTSFQVHSIGTARNYQQALTHFAAWIQKHRLGDLFQANRELALQYLGIRSQEIKQKTLDQERQAIQMHLGQKLPVIKSERETVLKSRAYTKTQIELILNAQKPKNRFATQIAYAAGLRAHELLTLKPSKEQPKSKRRQWMKTRFFGREGERYTVKGKGGLIREVLIPKALATQLESLRLGKPKAICDRQVNYQQYYDIAGGKAWTNSFSAASKRLFNWSQGAHGLRHTYAQERMEELQQRGFFYQEALEVVSQEMGHFRADVTEVYLR